MGNGFIFRQVEPEPALADFVDSFWMLHHPSDEAKEVMVLPDGRIDVILSQSATEPFQVTLLGLGIMPSQAILAPQTRLFAVSFKPLATEYVLHQTVADLCDTARHLPAGFWEFAAADLDHFEGFVAKATRKVQELVTGNVDERKRKLFALIQDSGGSATVQELAQQVFWSSRQINRYFNQQYGISLKTYCQVLRFRAAFPQIKEGRLFPEQAFSDQAHFIREIKHFSGTIPKELHRNRNGRFIQFSALSPP